MERPSCGMRSERRTAAQTLSHEGSWFEGAAWNDDESQILTWSCDGNGRCLGGGERGAAANLVP